MGGRNQAEYAIDFGKFENGIYSNTFFNLKVHIPESWNVMDDDARIALMQQGAKVAAGDNKNIKAVMDAADLRSVNLLTASESPIGAPVSSNPMLMIIAEKINHLPGIQRGSDFHYHGKKLMENSPMNVSFSREIYEASIGNSNFDVLEATVDMGHVKVHQKQYATIFQKYALVIVITYQDNDGMMKLEQILRSIEIKV